MEARLDALLDYRMPDIFGRRAVGVYTALQHSVRDAEDTATSRNDLRCGPLCQFPGLFCVGLAARLLGFARERPGHVARVTACNRIQLTPSR